MPDIDPSYLAACITPSNVAPALCFGANPPSSQQLNLKCFPRDVGITDLPESPTEELLQDDAFLQAFHHALLQVWRCPPVCAHDRLTA